MTERLNGARPVELMIMSDTCATHRSRVPRRSSRRIKGRATTVQDERGPGLDVILCFVCGSRPWGAAALLLCLFILLNLFKCSFLNYYYYYYYYYYYTSIAHNIPVHTKLSIVIYLYIQLSISILLFLIYLFFLILLFIICAFLFCHFHSVALQ